MDLFSALSASLMSNALGTCEWGETNGILKIIETKHYSTCSVCYMRVLATKTDIEIAEKKAKEEK